MGIGKLVYTPMDPEEIIARVDEVMKSKKSEYKQLQANKGQLEIKLTHLNAVRGYIDTFRTAITNVASSFKSAFQVSSSNTSVISASLNILKEGGYSAGLHQVVVNKLAQSQSTMSTQYFNSADAKPGADTIYFTVGSTNFSVNVDSDDTLTAVAAKINSLGNSSGISASVVAITDGEYRLIINSQKTGAANTFTVSDTLFGLSNNIQTAQDAEFLLDGYPEVIKRSSNSFNDVLSGVNLTLNALGSSAINVSEDQATTTNNVRKSIQALLDAYNQIMLYSDEVQADAFIDTGDPAHQGFGYSMTSNDPIFAQVKMMLQALMGDSNAVLGKKLSDIGIIPDAAVTFKVVHTNNDGSQEEVERKSNGSLTLKPYTSLLPDLFENALKDLSALDSLLNDKQNGILAKVANEIDNKINLAGQAGVIDKQKISFVYRKTLLEEQVTREGERLEQVRQDLIGRYAELNMLLSKMDFTSKYLSAQMDALKSQK